MVKFVDKRSSIKTLDDMDESENEVNELDRLVQNLREDRIIDVYVADDDIPHKVPESAFRRHQNMGIFIAALKYERLGAGPKSTLKFPDDGPAAFKLLLFWIIVGRLSKSPSNPLETCNGVPGGIGKGLDTS